MLKIHRPHRHSPDNTSQPIPGSTRHRTALLLPQHIAPGLTPSLHHQQSYIDTNSYTFSDAANSITESSLGIHRKPT